MKIRSKIILSFITLIFFIAAIELILVFQQTDLSHQLDTKVRNNVREIVSISDVSYWVQRTKSNLREVLVETAAGQPTQAEYGIQVVRHSIEQIDIVITPWKDLILKSRTLNSINDTQIGELQAVKDIIVRLKQFTASSQGFIDVHTLNPQSFDKKLLYFNTEIEPYSRKLKILLDRLKSNTQVDFKAELSNFNLKMETLGQLIIFVPLGTLLFAVAISFWIARQISNPLEKLTKATNEIANGNYEFEISSSSNDEVGKLTRDFNKMAADLRTYQTTLLKEKVKADAASRAKSDIMANMSHELRTPLNAIIGFSNTIQEEIFGPINNEKYKDYINDIYFSGAHLLDLINDILDVSAIEAGSLELVELPVCVNTSIENAIRLVTPRAREGRISIQIATVKDLPEIQADNRRINQILLNLLSNAIKFTPAGGVVTVSAQLNANDSLSVVVSDTGIGMDADEQKEALSMFGQVDSGLNRNHEGTGLGLPLTKGLMEMHNGTLQVTSAKGTGTIITATFPQTRVIMEQ
ncbi:MAG: HAMP domain-containing protein [Magnetovibrio sp.]|nr:HAMP domain-containing protein [Magnetovibrio sp.]